MSKDRQRYLEEAILNIERQLAQFKYDSLNKNANVAIVDNLGKQRLHFQQELVKLKQQPTQQSNGVFGILDILDEEETFRFTGKKDDPKPE